MKQKMQQNLTNDFINFLNNSPTAWHATENTVAILKSKGFQELKETEEWSLSPGRGYFVVRNGSSLCAFITPKKKPKTSRILASHSDSPALKLKPQPEIRKHQMILFGVEIYGAPLLSSWLNRDLGLAGRIVYYDQKGNIAKSLVKADDAPLVIPQLAIHLDREVNEKGLILNKQEHLNAVAAIDENFEGSYLLNLLRKKVANLTELINFDLFLYPLESAGFIGPDKQMIASYRLDNLAGLHISLSAFLSDIKPLESEIKMLVSWNHEEIGSNTVNGAGSNFISQTLERILLSYKLGRSDYFSLLNQSLCISIDLAQCVHPNYPEKHDAQHPNFLGKGLVLKHNAQHRYATDAESSLFIQAAAKKHNVPLQKFVNRNDIPCGSTIGPIHAALNGMPTVDIGIGMISMHSARELISTQDHLTMCHFLQKLFV